LGPHRSLGQGGGNLRFHFGHYGIASGSERPGSTPSTFLMALFRLPKKSWASTLEAGIAWRFCGLVAVGSVWLPIEIRTAIGANPLAIRFDIRALRRSPSRIPASMNGRKLQVFPLDLIRENLKLLLFVHVFHHVRETPGANPMDAAAHVHGKHHLVFGAHVKRRGLGVHGPFDLHFLAPPVQGGERSSSPSTSEDFSRRGAHGIQIEAHLPPPTP
jgi:hypothetical protein